MMRRVSIVGCVMVFLALGVPTALAAGPLQLMDYFNLEYASDPQISPDGKLIVYQRNFADVVTDTYFSNLWIVSIDGSNHRPLTTGKVHD